MFDPAKVEQEIVISLPEQLRYLRRHNAVTQKQIADALHIERSTYTYYEVRKTEPSLSMMVRLARLFDVTTDYLLGLQQEENKQSSFEKELSSLINKYFKEKKNEDGSIL